MRLCGTIADAVDVARTRKGMTHDALANRIGCTRAYVTMLQAGKRRWTVDAILRVCRATEDLSPVQWICQQVGGELHIDAIDAAIAMRELEIAELRHRKTLGESA